ncbi:hypothetical protein [Mycolicibacterium austroafricanum]|uniref:hypothetical protein n=1 Tax=Mycolicibacterium austroafricanum TaxID=39687 RepID=UPI001F2670FF|nr:hypothetical protein [Mycolicibacterium austroafricanum]
MASRLLMPIRIALCVFVMMMAATGCAALRKSMDIDYDDQRLNEGLRGVLHNGQTARLSDFTSWEWDEVHLFHEHTPRDFIDRPSARR